MGAGRLARKSALRRAAHVDAGGVGGEGVGVVVVRRAELTGPQELLLARGHRGRRSPQHGRQTSRLKDFRGLPAPAGQGLWWMGGIVGMGSLG